MAGPSHWTEVSAALPAALLKLLQPISGLETASGISDRLMSGPGLDAMPAAGQLVADGSDCLASVKDQPRLMRQ